MSNHQPDYEDQIFGSLGGKIISDTELAAILRYLKPRKTEKILDIGTGTGRVARRVAASGASVIGIDVNKENVRRASMRKKGLGCYEDNYDLIVADGRFLPFIDNCFDSLTCIRTIKYFQNSRAVIQEISRVLKNNGKLILTLSNVFSVDFILLRIGILAYKTLFNFRKAIQDFKNDNLVMIDFIGLHKIHPKIWTISNNTWFLNFLAAAENVLQKITLKELLSREIFVKFVKIKSGNEKHVEH